MRLIYTKPKLRDLSQGSRIAFVRQFRRMTQDEVADRLGCVGECKRRTMTRYEKTNRSPKEDRLSLIAEILDINTNPIKQYNYRNPIDIIFTLIWLEELIPNFNIDLSNVPNVNDENINIIKEFLEEWNQVRNKRLKREISYENYIEWKFNYEIKGESSNHEQIN